MHNFIGFLAALFVFMALVVLFGLVWLAGTVGERLTKLFQQENTSGS